MSLKYSLCRDYLGYLKKRFIKLLIPTYLTIIIILVFLFLGSRISGSFSITTQYVLNSLLLIDGNSIGFVWIVKVYLFIALLAPLLIWSVKAISNSIAFCALSIACISITSVIINNTPYNIFTHEYLFYAIQYSLVASIGYSFALSSKRKKIYCLFVFCCFYSVYQVMQHSFAPSLFKFPPKAYYLTYGLSVSAGLYLIFDSFIKKPGKISSFVFWMSKNSFTIYIFHIYFMWFVFLLERVIPSFNSVGWFFKYIFVVLFSIISCKAFLSFKNIVLISRMDKK